MENQGMSLQMIKGRKKFLILLVSFLVLSVCSQIFAFSTYKQFTIGRLYLGILRLGLEFGLLWAVYSGRAWARYIAIAVFLIGGILFLAVIDNFIKASLLGFILVPVICLYFYAVYLLSRDKDFLCFFEYQIENSYL
jgi:hypothetical protein